MREQWKTFANGNYEVSNHGRVRRKTSGKGTWAGRLLTLNLMEIGYHRVAPFIDGKAVEMYVHRLVAEYFIGPCPDGLEVNHKDDNKTNNRVSNLEYITHAENIKHGYRNRLGERHHAAKLTDAAVVDIRERRASGERGADLAREYGVSQQLVCDISKRRHRLCK